MIRENCYVVSDSTGECVIIDCGAYYEEERRAVVDYIRSNHLAPKHLLATHGHVDHNFGNNTIADEFGLKVECGSGDEGFMNDLKGQAEKMFNVVVDYDFPPIGHFFTNEEVITSGDHKFATIATPGHSPGGTTFYCAEEKRSFHRRHPFPQQYRSYRFRRRLDVHDDKQPAGTGSASRRYDSAPWPWRCHYYRSRIG